MLKALRFTVAAALAALLAVPALADTHVYLDPVYGFNDTNGHDGTTAALAWKTVSYANATSPAANTANGHVIWHLAAGVYPTLPNPATQPLDGKRYFIAGDISNIGSTQVAGGTITTSGTSFVGLKFNGTVFVDTLAKRDTIRVCTIQNDLIVWGPYDYCGNLTVGGNLRIARSDEVRAGGAYEAGRRIRVQGVVFNGITAATMSSFKLGATNDPSGNDTLNPAYSRYTDSCAVKFCNLSGTMSSSPWFGSYNATHLTLRGNHWNVTAASGIGSTVNAFLCRDSSTFTMDRDTLIALGPGTQVIFGENGQRSGDGYGSFGVDSSLFQVNGGGGGNDPVCHVYYAKNSFFTYTTFITRERALSMVGCVVGGAVRIDHCSFIGSQYSGIVNISDATFPGPHNQRDLVLTNNIFYGTSPPVTSGCGASGVAQKSAAVYWGQTSTIKNAVTSNWNLYANYDRVATASDKSVHYDASCGTIGASSGWKTAMHVTAVVGADTLSVYGSPMFGSATADSIPQWTAFTPYNARLGIGSVAILADSAGGDIGAVAYTALPEIYVPGAGELAFQHIIVDQTLTGKLVIGNSGPGVLSVSHITTSDPAVTVSVDTLSVGAGAQDSSAVVTVVVTGTPILDDAGNAIGVASTQTPASDICHVYIASNDPKRPLLDFPVYIGRGNLILSRD